MYNQISTKLAVSKVSETFKSPKYAAAVAVSGDAGVVVEGEER